MPDKRGSKDYLLDFIAANEASNQTMSHMPRTQVIVPTTTCGVTRSFRKSTASGRLNSGIVEVSTAVRPAPASWTAWIWQAADPNGEDPCDDE